MCVEVAIINMITPTIIVIKERAAMASDARLWKAFSLYIRLRDSDENGYGNCITCGRAIHYLKGDCGHGIGRQHKATKFNEMNNALQCKPCNAFEGGKREVYKEQVNRRYGVGTWEKLEVMSRTTCKKGQFEIDVMTKFYKEEVKKLLKSKA
jgi:hypothetical protein